MESNIGVSMLNLSMLCISWWVSVKPTLRFGVRSSLWIIFPPLPRFFLWLFKKKIKGNWYYFYYFFSCFCCKAWFWFEEQANQKDRPICAHCGLGHTKAQCYKLNGYPPNYKKNKYVSTIINHSNSSSVNQVSMDSVNHDSQSQLQLTAQQY